MPRVDLELGVDIERSVRVTQIEGIFDVPEAKRRTVDFHFDVPIEEREWKIGLIYGPSGAGKSSVARHLFGDAVVSGFEWDPRRAMLDSFPEMPIRDLSDVLSSVGFSSPPSWTKPHHVLSNGEKFRADIARAIVDDRPLIVLDEFTSVVDRTVARVASHSVQKAIRRREGKRLVAVSCHDDIIDWLQPDWTLEPHVGGFNWRSLQRRPPIELEIYRCSHEAWRWFAPHHYLSNSLHRGARCFIGYVDGRVAAFAAILSLPHPRRSDLSRLSRVVILPEFQGLGLGVGAFTETIARITAINGRTLCVASSHPALIKAWGPPLWRASEAHFSDVSTSSLMRTGPMMKTGLMKTTATRRRIARFMWIGGRGEIDPVVAEDLWRARTDVRRTRSR